MDERSLAKSYPKEDIQTHTDYLLNNLDILKSLYPNLISDWELLRLACIYHDLGKMNDKFQARITTGRQCVGEIAHGLLSLAFIDYKKLKEMCYNDKDIELLFHAIAYHHDRRLPLNNREIEREFPGLRIALERFNYDKVINKFCSEEINQRYFCVGEQFSERKHGDQFFRFIMFKGLLNRLDYAASAHIPVENRNDFLEDAMDNVMIRWQRSDSNARWNEMQKYMKDNTDRNVIVVAQTGMGKTEAGLLWLGNNKGFFTLPLKSAINAIYQRIISNIVTVDKEDRIGLLHSDTFIRYIEQNELDSAEPSIYYAKTRQFSLPLTICTLDQLFNFVFRYRGFEQKLATLAYSKLIVDEVQMYSPELIAYLVLGLCYITRMHGKFAILTATLPSLFVDLLKEYSIEVEPPRYFTNDLVRHSLKVVDKEIGADDIIGYIHQYGGRKILIICNTIKSAVSIYLQIRDEMAPDQQVHLLHSHFIKSDRAEKEKHILDMGQEKSNECGVWIATQIVEASLDIDFDLLFTELSDLNGLFQRMGRCYRKRSLDIPYNCFVFNGGDKRCSGVGTFIDEKIFRLSKQAISVCDGVIGEVQKLAMVENLYTKDNLPEYYDVIKKHLNYVKSCRTNELNQKEAVKRFRDMDNVSVIPRSVYEENEIEINAAICDLLSDCGGEDKDKDKDKDKKRMRRARARSQLIGYTVDVASYVISNMKTETRRISNYEQLVIIDCDYNNEEGLIRASAKCTSGIDDFLSHSF